MNGRGLNMLSKETLVETLGREGTRLTLNSANGPKSITIAELVSAERRYTTDSQLSKWPKINYYSGTCERYPVKEVRVEQRLKLLKKRGTLGRFFLAALNKGLQGKMQDS